MKLLAFIFEQPSYEYYATDSTPFVVFSIKGDCTGSSEPTLVKMPHCWKSHVTTQMVVSRSDKHIVFGLKLV